MPEDPDKAAALALLAECQKENATLKLQLSAKDKQIEVLRQKVLELIH